jgi:hypothetical protein
MSWNGSFLVRPMHHRSGAFFSIGSRIIAFQSSSCNGEDSIYTRRESNMVHSSPSQCWFSYPGPLSPPKSGCRSVGIVRLRTKSRRVCFVLVTLNVTFNDCAVNYIKSWKLSYCENKLLCYDGAQLNNNNISFGWVIMWKLLASP